MAKGARSHTRAKNHARLRATVFGPVIDERTKRLSAKLQEIASQPLSKDAEMADADFKVIDKTKKDSKEMQKEEMDIDAQPDAAKSTSEGNGGGRIQKRSRRKKRSSITFKPHPGKLRRMAKKK